MNKRVSEGLVGEPKEFSESITIKESDLEFSHVPFLLKDEYVKIRTEISELESQLTKLIDRTIDECDHPIDYIQEKPYKDKGWLGTDPPWLICTACGLTEEGWGCGYKELKHAAYENVPEITWELWLKTRTRSVFQDGRIVQ